MIEVIKDTLIDVLKLLPFLFIAFLIIEVVEHKLSNKSKKVIEKSGKFGPLVGGLLGLFPQCGFSVLATNLYITRIVSLGTLISIYLTTSDEMIPVLLSNNVDIKIIVNILLIKLIIGVVSGFVIDFLLRKKRDNKINHDICEHDHCKCEDGIIKSSIKHTIKVTVFILIVTFILNTLFYYVGDETIKNVVSNNRILSIFISSLIGLIPNCASSVVITTLYVSASIPFASLISGLLTGSGVAILVLFKNNKNVKENLLIISIIYLIGVVSGIIINLF